MNIYEKLAAVQQELKAPKDKKNTFAGYNYRSAEGILEAVKPVLAKYKCTIYLSDEIREVGDRVYVRSEAVFVDTEELSEGLNVTAYAREQEEKKGLDASQITGTASSYARKYALNALLLIDDTKDADTDEYQRITNSPQKTPEKGAKKEITDAQKKTIKLLAKNAGIDLDNVLKKTLDEFSADEATALMLELRKK